MTMTGFALGHHFAAGHVQGGKQGGRAVPLVVVRNAFHVAQAQGQHRLTSFQGLDLALLVHAQDQGVLRGMQVQAGDIPYFVNEKGIAGQLEVLLSVGLQTIGAPNAMDRVLAQAGFLSHGAHGPLGFVLGLGLQGLVDHLGDLLIRDRSRRPGAPLIVQAWEPVFEKASAPLADRHARHPHRGRDRFIGPALGGQQNHLGSPHQPVGKTP